LPLYEYECEACGQRFEVIQKFSDSPIATCIKCGKGPVQKLLSSPAIQFKGSGWYITDYARAGKSDGSGAGEKAEKSDKTADQSSTASKGEATSETKTKTETKAESKSESKSESKPR